jgi:hypothetical protein
VTAKASKNSLRGTRRRLSVVSDNKLIEGIATLGTVDHEETLSHMGEHVVRTYAGLSKKGYAPYNPRKRNQDAILMEEHKPTGTLIFGVFDGHGEAGDLVSHYFTERLPSRVVAHPRFSTDPGVAMADEIDRLEKALLAGQSIDSPESSLCAIVALLAVRWLFSLTVHALLCLCS